MEGTRDVIRHYLAALAYRFQGSLRGAPDGFAGFDAGSGVRPPGEIVRHMTHVLKFVLSAFDGSDVENPEALDWSGEVARFHTLLARIDGEVEAGQSPRDTTLEVCLQGPLADAMTHVGQLAMLRRLAGSPVRGESFRKADMRIGRVGPDQPDPVHPL